jgi:drug/metabolite transporter (DMT)-like permease
MSTDTRRFAQGLLLGVLAMVLVGGSVAVSEILGDAPLFTVQAIRYGAAAALLLLLSRVAGVEIVRPRGHEWLWLSGIAATGLVLFNLAVVRGVAHAEPAAIAVAIACVPVIIGLIGPLLDGQRPARRVVMAAVVVTMGGVIVEGTGRTDAAGIAWAVITLLCEAAFTLLAIPVLRRQGVWGVSVHTVWIATIMLVVLGLLTEGPDAAMRLRADHWAAIGYLAVLVTAVAFVCWYSSVAIVGAGRAGLLTGVAPPAAATASALSIGQLPALPVWLGMGVVCVGLGIGLASRRPVVPVPQTQAAGSRAAVLSQAGAPLSWTSERSE